MARQEAEEAIMEKLKEIREILRYYSPDCVFLSMYIQDGFISIHGSAKAEKPLGCYKDLDAHTEAQHAEG